MRLYHDQRAPNPRRVRIFASEKQLTLELVAVPLAERAAETPEFLAKHPLGLLPVLELDDGRRLRESMAICRYLEDLHPEPNLCGRDAWERATIEQWNRHAEFELMAPIAQAFRNTHAYWQGRIPQAPEFGAIMRDLALARLAWFDRELADRAFIAGDRFTVADITALCGIEFGKLANIRLSPEAHPNLTRWHASVAARPSYKA